MTPRPIDAIVAEIDRLTQERLDAAREYDERYYDPAAKDRNECSAFALLKSFKEHWPAIRAALAPPEYERKTTDEARYLLSFSNDLAADAVADLERCELALAAANTRIAALTAELDGRSAVVDAAIAFTDGEKALSGSPKVEVAALYLVLVAVCDQYRGKAVGEGQRVNMEKVCAYAMRVHARTAAQRELKEARK